MGMAPLSPLNVIQTMIQNKKDITFLKDLREEEQSLIFNPDEADTRANLYKKLYSENNFFSLATFYLTINEFVKNQLKYLNDNPWTKNISDNQPDYESHSDNEFSTDESNVNSLKSPVMDNLFNPKKPSFYTERRIIGQDDKTYLVADLHGDPSPILDILTKLEENKQFDKNTGKISDDTHLCFKGDFVDKGVNGSACLLLAYSLKILNPDNVIIVRGNHEDPDFLTICDEKKPESLNFGHEIYCKYYASNSYTSRFLSFLFPAKKLKEEISKSYAVMPVTAFILHPVPQQTSVSISEEDSSVDIDSQQYYGFVASHAGLDPALYPERLLAQKINTQPKKVLFDRYDTEKKLHPNNKKCEKALKKEIKKQLDSYLSEHQYTIRLNALKYCDGKIKDLTEALQKAKEIKDDSAHLILEQEIEVINTIRNTSNETSMDTDAFEYLIQEQSKIKTSGYTLVTRGGVSQEIFQNKKYNFEPVKKPRFLEYYETFFNNDIRSLRDVAACWHWKVPDKTEPSFFKANTGGNIEFSMSYKVFEALFNDWSEINNNIRFTLASQGHIQAAHLAYNQFKDNQDAIINGNGYGDSWQQPTVMTLIEPNREKELEFREVKFQFPANPVIAASCGSIYGCSPTKEEFQKECHDQLEKCKTDEEKKTYRFNYKNKYPGQSYNSIVCLSYDKNRSAIIAQQSNMFHYKI
jgi:hypothetical protein